MGSRVSDWYPRTLRALAQKVGGGGEIAKVVLFVIETRLCYRGVHLRRWRAASLLRARLFLTGLSCE